MARITVQGHDAAAVKYGVLRYLERTDRRFDPKVRIGRHRVKANRDAANAAVDYALTWAKANADRVYFATRVSDPADHAALLAHDAMADAVQGDDAPKFIGGLIAVLLGGLGRELLKLVLILVLEWLVSADACDFRGIVLGVA